jgi:hypothetical protein
MLMAIVVALPVAWAAGMFEGDLATDHWFAVGLVLAVGWLAGGLLVSFMFLSARLDRTAALYEATARSDRRVRAEARLNGSTARKSG